MNSMTPEQKSKTFTDTTKKNLKSQTNNKDKNLILKS